MAQRTSATIEGTQLIAHYLSESDHPWLRALVEERARYCGRRAKEWEERLLEPLSVAAPEAKLPFAVTALSKYETFRAAGRRVPRQIREVVFRSAAAEATRQSALAAAGKILEMEVRQIEELILGDLPEQRILGELEPQPTLSQLALEANMRLMGSIMRRALNVRVEAYGNLRQFIRQVKFSGLVCVVRGDSSRSPPSDEERGVQLEISGPLAIFRRTTLYGRTLSQLVPRLAWCHEFRMEAECYWGKQNRLVTFVVTREDPIVPDRELPAFDSQVEQRLARDLGKIALDWEIIREPVPKPIDHGLFFPDFEIRHRRDPQRSWFLEIIGFWTPEYLNEKLRKVREAGLQRLILCVDRDKNCGNGDFPAGTSIITYRRRIDPRRVLALLEGGT